MTDIGTSGDARAPDAPPSDLAGAVPGADVTSPHTCQHTYWWREPFSPPAVKGRSLRVMALPGGDLVVAGQYADPKSGGALVLGATRYTPSGALVWNKRIHNVMPTGAGAPLNPDADAVDASHIYLGWTAPGEAGGGAKTGWRVAALDHAGQLQWTRPRGAGRSVQVVCLAASGTTVFAVGGEVVGRERGTGKELTTPIIGRLSPHGQVLGVTKAPSPDASGQWRGCAYDEMSSTLVLVGVSGQRGWVSARTPQGWRFNKRIKPPRSPMGMFAGVAVTEAGDYVITGAVWRGWDWGPQWGAWHLGLDHAGHVRFNVWRPDSAQWSKLPLALPSGGFVTLTSRAALLYLKSFETLRYFDAWGNPLFDAVIGFKLVGGPLGLQPESFRTHDMIRLEDGSLVTVGQREAVAIETGALVGFGRVYHTDMWGYTSCKLSRKCGSLTPDDCADRDPCTRDVCLPDFGCKNFLLSFYPEDDLICGEGKVCFKDGNCAAKRIGWKEGSSP